MKRGVELVVFISGMILMALEIAGGRLLVFDYGGSVYVWGSIIAVVLSGLSVGYYYGGRLADKKPKEEVLSFLILMASLLILIIPLVYPSLVGLISGIPNMFAPLIIVTLLFFLPSVLLGGVSPYAIKLGVKKLKKIGKVSGDLYALATVGSVTGTFLATFVLILFMKINHIFILLSASLMLVVLALKNNKKLHIGCWAVLFVIFFTFFANEPLINASPEFTEGADDMPYIEKSLPGENLSVIFESAYGPVKVADKNGRRRMYISNGIMGSMFLDDKYGVVPGWEYLDLMVNVSVFLEAEEALILGVGAGVVPTRLNEQHGVYIDAVDISGVVLDSAQAYFGLNPSETLKIHEKDAREYLKESDEKYDVVVMDTFKYMDGHHVIPPHLATIEYYELVEDHLDRDGALVMMMFNDKKENGFMASEYKTISSVFDNVYVFDARLMIVVASNEEIEFTEDFLEQIYSGSIYDGIIYTDDYVPLVF